MSAKSVPHIKQLESTDIGTGRKSDQMVKNWGGKNMKMIFGWGPCCAGNVDKEKIINRSRYSTCKVFVEINLNA